MYCLHQDTPPCNFVYSSIHTYDHPESKTSIVLQWQMSGELPHCNCTSSTTLSRLVLLHFADNSAVDFCREPQTAQRFAQMGRQGRKITQHEGFA